jgi:hypothetical protein
MLDETTDDSCGFCSCSAAWNSEYWIVFEMNSIYIV